MIGVRQTGGKGPSRLGRAVADRLEGPWTTAGCRSRPSRPSSSATSRIRSNLAESSVADTPLRDLAVELDDLVLMYGDHLGRPGLRAAIAAPARRLGADDVLVTPGAAAALFIVHTTLLGPGDELVVVRPNYATNLETPRAIGATVHHLDLRYEDGWAVDPDRIAALMTPRTTLVSLTTPHNPTGQVMSEAALREVVRLVEAHPRARLLVDETYREMTFAGRCRWRRRCPSGSSACRRCRRPTGCRGSGSAG